MDKSLAILCDEEVRQIVLLVETLEQSPFDFLQLELGDLKVTLGKGNVPLGTAPPDSNFTSSAIATSLRSALPGTPLSVPVVENTIAPQSTGISSTPIEGTVAVVAPMIGRFYAKPEPGAEPFVSVGTEVNPDFTVALVEVMKVFTAVRAGVGGLVMEVCVQDGQLVEYGQVLFRVRPS